MFFHKGQGKDNIPLTKWSEDTTDMPAAGYLQRISPVIRAILFIQAMRPQFK